MLAVASRRSGLCVSGGIRTWRRSSGHSGDHRGAEAPLVLQISMKYRGMCPLFVYYRVAVLFSKWYVSDRAVTIV